MDSRRKIAQNLSAFAAAIASPVSIDVVAFPWRANARMAISFSANTVAGDLTVLVNEREFSVPTLAANVIHRMDYIERGRKIAYTSDVPGKLKVYVLDQWNRAFLVAQNP